VLKSVTFGGKNWRENKKLVVFSTPKKEILKKVQEEGMWMRKQIERRGIDFLKSAD